MATLEELKEALVKHARTVGQDKVAYEELLESSGDNDFAAYLDEVAEDEISEAYDPELDVLFDAVTSEEFEEAMKAAKPVFIAELLRQHNG